MRSGDVAIIINKADANVSVTGYTGVYDAAAHGASVGTITGVDAEGTAIGTSIDLGLAFTNVPGGTATWTFTGGTNYNDQSGDVAIEIGKATASITVNGYAGVYDAAAHGASLDHATGVNGVDLSGLVDLGLTFTNVPGGTATWVFTDVSGNYNDESGTAAIVISKADAPVVAH